MEAVHEHDLRFPAEQFLGQRIIRNPIVGSGRHFGMQLNPGVVVHGTQDLTRRVDHFDAFHSAKIDGSAIIDALGGQNSTSDNVIDVRPAPYLLACAPDHERVLTDESASNHGHDSVVFDTPRPIYGKVPAGSGVHAPVLVVSAESHLTHQFR